MFFAFYFLSPIHPLIITGYPPEAFDAYCIDIAEIFATPCFAAQQRQSRVKIRNKNLYCMLHSAVLIWHSPGESMHQTIGLRGNRQSIYLANSIRK
jgi:hypothetical protein